MWRFPALHFGKDLAADHLEVLFAGHLVQFITQFRQSGLGQEVETQVRAVEGRVEVLGVLIGEVLVLFGEFLDDLLAELVVCIRSWHNVTFLALTCVSDLECPNNSYSLVL